MIVLQLIYHLNLGRVVVDWFCSVGFVVAPIILDVVVIKIINILT